jgi:hypothetical protein
MAHLARQICGAESISRVASLTNSEASDVVGRDYSMSTARQPGQGYRNGYRSGRLKTAEGAMEYLQLSSGRLPTLK